jgi:peptidoglycan-associated lipoprotein
MKLTMGRLLVLVLVAVMAGCSSKGGTKDVAVEDHSMGADAPVLVVRAGAGSYDMAALNDPNSPLSNRVIYFEFDSAEFPPIRIL